MRRILPIIYHHHERLDGSGYPDGISGAEIPQVVRIVSVADVFDALTTGRAYRTAMTFEQAWRVVDEEVAGRLDPAARRLSGKPSRPPASAATPMAPAGGLGPLQVLSALPWAGRQAAGARDDPVAPRALGGVERLVGPRAPGLEARPGREERNPGAERHVERPGLGGKAIVENSSRSLLMSVRPRRPAGPRGRPQNSSPPRRPMRSVPRKRLRSSAPSAARTRSPVGWPCRSLTDLKESRSRLTRARPRPGARPCALPGRPAAPRGRRSGSRGRSARRARGARGACAPARAAP